MIITSWAERENFSLSLSLPSGKFIPDSEWQHFLSSHSNVWHKTLFRRLFLTVIEVNSSPVDERQATHKSLYHVLHIKERDYSSNNSKFNTWQIVWFWSWWRLRDNLWADPSLPWNLWWQWEVTPKNRDSHECAHVTQWLVNLYIDFLYLYIEEEKEH